MLLSVLVVTLCLALAGCKHEPPASAALPPPVVTVSQPLEREVTDYYEYTGRTAAVDAVEVWNSLWCTDGTLGPHPQSLALARGKRIVVGQDVHKAKHVSGVHIVTESSDVVADLMARRYVLARGARTWTLDEMRRMRAAPFLQRFRTPLLRAALKSYRWIRLTLIERGPARDATPQPAEVRTVADHPSP